MQPLDLGLQSLRLRLRTVPPLLHDLGLAVPGAEQIRNGRCAVQLLPRNPHLPPELPRRLLNRTRRPVIELGRQQLLELYPELFERLPCRLGIGTEGVSWWELDVFVAADDGESGLEIRWPHAGLEQIEHVSIACGPRIGDELSPGAVAELFILHLVQLGEAG